MAKTQTEKAFLDDNDEKPNFFGRLKASGRGPLLLLIGLLLFLVVVYVLVLNAIRPHTPGREITIDELLQKVRDKEVTEVTLLAEDHRLIGTDAGGDWWTGIGPNDLLAPQLLSDFSKAGLRTRIDTQTSKNLLRTATQFVLPAGTFAVFFVLIFYVQRRRSDGNEEWALMGRARGRRYSTGEDSSVTFADVAGLEEAITELKEVRDFLKHPETFERLGAKPPRGILLLGPPGCGKTLLAKAVAGEAGVPFFSVSASSFMEMLVGVGPSRVRDLFQKAKAAAPSIVFVDEIDAVGRTRSTGSMNPEGESTLNELLIQLDGFDTAQRVVLMAATNRADILDSALLRKGRFDRQVVIDVPDKAGRLAIFKVHARGKPMAPDVDFERFAGRTVGLSGADIAAVMNEAATLAARARLNAIGNKEMSEGIDRVISGAELHSRILGPDEKRRVAYHEAGHTLVGWVLNSSVTVEKVSIVARGHALGLTWSLPIEDRRLKTRSQIEEEITAALAGRAAENVVYDDDPSGGSQSDLIRATTLARQMVYDLGMSDLGPVFLGSRESGYSSDLSDHVIEQAEGEMRRILDEADQRAMTVLTAYRSHLDRLVDLLVAEETLEHEDLAKALGDLPKGLPSADDLAAKGSRRSTKAGSYRGN